MTLFFKTWTTGHWHLDKLWPTYLLRSHVWLYPRIIVTKSHEYTSKYIQWPFFQNLNQRSLVPRWPLTHTSVEVTCVTLPKDHCNQVPWIYIKVYTVTFFFQNLNHRSLTPWWPLTPSLSRSHVWLYPRIIVSKASPMKIHQSMWMYSLPPPPLFFFVLSCFLMFSVRVQWQQEDNLGLLSFAHYHGPYKNKLL